MRTIVVQFKEQVAPTQDDLWKQLLTALEFLESNGVLFKSRCVPVYGGNDDPLWKGLFVVEANFLNEDNLQKTLSALRKLDLKYAGVAPWRGPL